jgi:pSer/pThr/pTyr-binding forkhead associated (FHA) protein
MPRLIVKLPGGPKSVPVGDEAVTIGRTSDNTIPIDGEGVSRRHVQILFVGKGYELVDMGSRNGTKVNGQKVTRAILKAGDVIHVGGVDIAFEDDAAAGGMEIEELDLGGAASSAPAPAAASPTMAMQAGVPGSECVLRFIDGEKKGTEVALKGARTTFGRRSSNTVSFQDAGVSGVHCEITREANGYVVRDLGSTNGTLVDGEPVVELLLRHNSRIRIGAQRILFVDPTVADIESSLAGADDASEWGLMRGEIDVTAARGRGGRGALVAVVVLAAAAGGAWWILSKQSVKVEVAAVKGNVVTDASFEEGVSRWFSPGEGGAAARVVGTQEAPRAASGFHSLEVQPQGEGLARVEFSAAAQGGADNSVAPDSTYEVSAKVGSGSGAVVVVWVSSLRPDLVREVSTPVVAGGASWTETKAVVTAPAHATAARVQLAAFGGGAAVFDDVVFRPAGAAPPPDLASGELRVRVDSGGFIEAVRGGEVLLTQGGVAPSVDAPVETLLGATLAAPPAHSGNAITASGTAPGGGAFDVKAEAVGGGALLSAVPKGGPGAFTFTCPAGMGRGAVTLVMEKSALVLSEEESSRQEGVRKIIVGGSDGPQPFVLSADPASPGFSFTARRTTRGLRIQLAPPAGASPAVRLSVDLSLETEAAGDLLKVARNAETDGRLGDAAEAFTRVALAYHYLPDFRTQGEKESARLLGKARAEMKAANESWESGRVFKAAPDLERALAILEPLIAGFEGHAIAEDAKKLKALVDAQIEKVRGAAVADRVEKLYAQARNWQESGRPVLRLRLLEEIVRIAPPDDDFRLRAEKEMEEARREADAEREKLYGRKK